MSWTGLEAFDKTLQITNLWLQEIGRTLGPDRKRCYHALAAVLHALRDQLPPAQSAHLAAELPMLVRGIYFQGWSPAPNDVARSRHLDGFLDQVQAGLAHMRPIGADDACMAVFRVLHMHLSDGTIDKIQQSLPAGIRALWSQAFPPPRDSRPPEAPPL